MAMPLRSKLGYCAGGDDGDGGWAFIAAAIFAVILRSAFRDEGSPSCPGLYRRSPHQITQNRPIPTKCPDLSFSDSCSLVLI
jgi:hypothetical protein